MSDMPWFRFFPSDWLGGTRGMSAAETGIYITIIATMYEREGKIAYDPPRLARMCGASNSVLRSCIERLIDDGKVSLEEGFLTNYRVVEELSYRLEKSQVGLKAANARWNEKDNKNNAKSDANAMPAQSERNAIQKPELEPEKKDIILSPKSAPKPRNGSRLPDDWVLPKAWGNWALENVSGATVESVRSQADQFRDYWVGKAGASARKADWEATWRNWMRNAKAIPKPSLPAQKPRTIAEASARLVAQMREAENANTQSRPDGELFEQNVRYLAAPER